MNTKKPARMVSVAVGLAVVWVFGAVMPAAAGPSPEDLCASTKVKAAGKKRLAKLVCHAKAFAKDVEVDPECTLKAETKFDLAFQKAEAKAEAKATACISTGDTAAVEFEVDEFVDQMVGLQTTGELFPSCTSPGACGDCGDGICLMDAVALDTVCLSEGSAGPGDVGCVSNADCAAREYCFHVSPTDTVCLAPCESIVPVMDLDKVERACAASKLKATGKKALSISKCHAKAIKKALEVDPACLDKASDKFETAFAKTEAKGGCRSLGDVADVEDAVDGSVLRTVLLETTPIVIVPLPSCSEVATGCGSCPMGACVGHDPAPGCVSFDTFPDALVECVSDAECPASQYCMNAGAILDPDGLNPLIPDWFCMLPCP